MNVKRQKIINISKEEIRSMILAQVNEPSTEAPMVKFNYLNNELQSATVIINTHDEEHPVK